MADYEIRHDDLCKECGSEISYCDVTIVEEKRIERRFVCDCKLSGWTEEWEDY